MITSNGLFFSDDGTTLEPCGSSIPAASCSMVQAILDRCVVDIKLPWKIVPRTAGAKQNTTPLGMDLDRILWSCRHREAIIDIRAYLDPRSWQEQREK